MRRSTFQDWLSLLQFLAIVGGAAWALFIYRTTRRGEASVAIEHSCSLVSDFALGKSLLLIRVRLRNTSSVLWRWNESALTLFDARKLADDRSLRLVPFAEADPFLPVYGDMTEEAEDFGSGEAFVYSEDQQISLEPGEVVESEIAIPLVREKLGLMAANAWFSGFQRTRSGDPYEWSTFFYINPRQLEEARNSAYHGES